MDSLNILAILFKQNNATLFKVGGCVRDEIIGLNNPDVDLTSKLTIDEVEKIIENTQFKLKKIHKNLGFTEIWHKNQKWDYATFRKEVYKNNGSHFPKKVVFVKKMRTDAKRRDFTINAIYENVLTKKRFYFFGAKKHLKNRILKTCKNAKKSFCEDSLRILRLLRFSSKLNFNIEKQTLKSAICCKHLLKNLSQQVLQKEIKKMSPNAKQTQLWKLLELNF